MSSLGNDMTVLWRLLVTGVPSFVGLGVRGWAWLEGGDVPSFDETGRCPAEAVQALQEDVDFC